MPHSFLKCYNRCMNNDKHWELMQSKGCRVIAAPEGYVADNAADDEDDAIAKQVAEARQEFAKKKQELRLLALFIKKYSAKSA